MWLLAATYTNAAFLCSHIEAPESGIFIYGVLERAAKIHMN
jgi:hypothetical protein